MIFIYRNCTWEAGTVTVHKQEAEDMPQAACICNPRLWEVSTYILRLRKEAVLPSSWGSISWVGGMARSEVEAERPRTSKVHTDHRKSALARTDPRPWYMRKSPKANLREQRQPSSECKPNAAYESPNGPAEPLITTKACEGQIYTATILNAGQTVKTFRAHRIE